MELTDAQKVSGLCLVDFPADTCSCTLDADHDSDHEAWGRMNTVLYHSWPRSEDDRAPATVDEALTEAMGVIFSGLDRALGAVLGTPPEEELHA